MFQSVLRWTLLVSFAGCAGAQQVMWSEGPWQALAPPASSCAALPVVIVRGPAGSLFDPANTAALSSFERALPAALAKICPRAQQAVVASGRIRKLMEATAQAAETPAPTAPTPAPASGGGLRSLAAAKGDEGKCEVLLAWLESAKSAAEPASRMRAPRGEMLRAFRDEPMQAVFGMPFDQTQPAWRMEVHEKSIAPCLGMQPQRRGLIPRIPSRTMQLYWSQFHAYRAVLDQAFLGQPGEYEPAAINRYLEQFRAQQALVREAGAANPAPSRQAFDMLTAQRQSLRARASLLSEAERKQMDASLAQRQAAMAPAVADAWLAENSVGGGVAAARLLHSRSNAIAPVIAAMAEPARAAWNDTYRKRLGSLVEAPLKAERAQLAAFPATLAGAQQLAAWKAGFDTNYGGLRTAVDAVELAAGEYQQARSRVLAGALPAWLREAQAVPTEAGAIVAKRRELDTVFPAQEDRASPLFTQFDAPLRAKEDQLRARAAAAAAVPPPSAPAPAVAATPAAQTSAANGAPSTSAGKPMDASALKAQGLANQGLLQALYEGNFRVIALEREDPKFSGLFEEYLKAFGQRCAGYLPANKIEMTRQECTTERVTTRGGVETGRYCVNWVTVGIGIYADPILYDALRTSSRLSAGDSARHLGRMLTDMTRPGGDPLRGMMQMVGDVQSWNSDMKSIVQMNACNSPALDRLEDNLRLFALNRPPIKLDGSSAAATSPALAVVPGLPYRDHNYARLVEDLVAEHAKTWAMNRYLRGSVTGVSVVARDSGGRPLKITANYAFNGFQGRSHGSVKIDFSDGLPECMFFHDYPASCRTPNRNIVAAYAEGKYQQ